MDHPTTTSKSFLLCLSLFLFIAAAFPLYHVTAANANPLPLVVRTSEGMVQGQAYSDQGMILFKTIPYASPPIGKNRFAPPQPPTPYVNEFYNASIDSPKACMQVSYLTHMDEDCLYLDIYTPAVSSSTLYPVYVWIHGGAFIVGSKEEFNFASFPNAGVIVVAINYRLGPWGYLRVDTTNPGNRGFLDQVQALKWVQKNILNFGGDPKKITLGGQSAGANSVELHLTSPASRGLFHGAFMESPMAYSYYPIEEDALATAEEFAKVLECTNVLKSCILNATSSFIMERFYYYQGLCQSAQVPYYGYNIDKAYWFCGMAPEVGNHILPGQMMDALNSPANNVPILIGTVWNEGNADSSATYNYLRSQAAYMYTNDSVELTEFGYLHFLNQIVDHAGYEDDETSYSTLYSKRAQQIYSTYPYERNDGFKEMYPSDYNGFKEDDPLDANYVYNELYHDKWYLCPAMSSMKTVLKNKKSKSVYMYRFMQPTVLQWYMFNVVYGGDPITAVGNGFFSANLYPSHGDDLPFFHLMLDRLYTDDEKTLAFRMFSALVDFIHTGDPNTGPLSAHVGAEWEVFNPRNRNMIYLLVSESSSPHVENVRSSQCEFWEDMNFVFSAPSKTSKKTKGKTTKKTKGVKRILA